jgi:lipopolysaccharide transport system ATP-binding protein
LEDGQVVADGPAREIVAAYMHEGSCSAAERSWPDIDASPGGEVAHLTHVRIKDQTGQTAASIDIREAVGLEMTFEVIQGGYTLLPHFKVANDEGVLAFVTLDVDPKWRKKKRPKGSYTATAWVPGNLLAEGSFFIHAAMTTLEPQRILQFHEKEAVSFQVVDPMEGDSARGDWTKDLRGLVRPLLAWETEYTGTN